MPVTPAASAPSNSFLHAYNVQIIKLEQDPNATEPYKAGLEKQFAAVKKQLELAGCRERPVRGRRRGRPVPGQTRWRSATRPGKAMTVGKFKNGESSITPSVQVTLQPGQTGTLRYEDGKMKYPDVSYIDGRIALITLTDGAGLARGDSTSTPTEDCPEVGGMWTVAI